MLGYKALDDNLINRYGFQYEVGKTYYLDGDLKWMKNGFHFCTRPEDTLRYVNGCCDYKIVEVRGYGDLIKYDDEQYDFYDMYVSSIMDIIRIIPREELFDMIINTYDDRVKRFIILSELNEEEKKIIINKYPNLEFYINYYQNKEHVLKRKLDI